MLAPLLFVAGTAARADGPDGGTPASIFARCVVPDAGDFPLALDGGWIALSPARASYDACRIGAGISCDSMLAGGVVTDGGYVLPQEAAITAIVGAAVTVFGIYATNRTARHLSLIP